MKEIIGSQDQVHYLCFSKLGTNIVTSTSDNVYVKVEGNFLLSISADIIAKMSWLKL